MHFLFKIQIKIWWKEFYIHHRAENKSHKRYAKDFFFFCIIVVVSGTLIMWVWWAGSPSWPPAAAAACSPRSSSTGRWPASAPAGRGNASGGSEYYFYIPRLNCKKVKTRNSALGGSGSAPLVLVPTVLYIVYCTVYV